MWILRTDVDSDPGGLLQIKSETERRSDQWEDISCSRQSNYLTDLTVKWALKGEEGVQ